ncbi:AfsR/SARP family transcriptional regulator [Plantactinospora sp. WMMC1484]|uniref:AfsR/SARP family transcriptional regulator n=1 Tax=Plantactinospora sp. WMMC1484 TaxID=3404122 RepID=UPI003BF50E1C
MRAVTFRLLGPVEVRVDDRPVRLAGPRSQAILAAMLLEPDRLVPVSRLVDATWGESPPASANVQVRNRVAEMRRLLRGVGVPEDTIETRGSGYLLRLASGQLDLDVFERRVAEAEDHARRGELAEAVEWFAAALTLWRGPALDGLRTPVLAAAAQRLEERRMAVVGYCIDLELDLGRYDLVIGKLHELVDAYPWREPLVGRLIRALYLANRQREALERFDQLRTRLADELGVDPSAELVELRDLILRNDPSLRSGAARPPGGPTASGARPRTPAGPQPRTPAESESRTAAGPQSRTAAESESQPPQVDTAGDDPVDAAAPPARMLPAEVSDFVGREPEVTAVLNWLPAEPKVTVVMISGLPGVGKTSLAVRIAHRLGPRYPGAQLYVDLAGHEHPLTPVEVLGRFLRALGVPGDDLPADLDERAARFRAAVAGQPCLLVLDNAGSAAQVRPLLPGIEAVVLVTGRRALVDLDGAHQLRLRPMPEPEAVRLLAGIVGADRVSAEPDSAARIVRHCGLLPLAVRIFAARLAVRSLDTLGQAAEQLAEATHRLDHLTRADRSVRAAFQSAYVGLDVAARRVLRRLAVLDLDDAPGWLVPVLLPEEPATAADEVVGGLVEASLLEVTGPDGAGQLRYHVHDLVRAFARERADAEEPADGREGLLRRVLASWLSLTEEARVRLSQEEQPPLAPDLPRLPAPTDAHRRDPHAWFTAEATALLTMIERAAAEHALADYAWALTWNCDYFLQLDVRLDDLSRVTRIGLAAARRRGDPEGIARMRLCVAFAVLMRGDLEPALDHIRGAGDGVAEPWLRAEISGVEHQIQEALGNFAESRTALIRAIDLYTEAGDAASTGTKLARLGMLQLQQGDPAAGDTLIRSVALLRAVAATRPLALGLRGLAAWHGSRGDIEPARTAYLESLDLVRSHRDHVGEVVVLSELAAMLTDHLRLVEAAGFLDTALDRARRLDVPLYAAYARSVHGRWRLAAGEPGPARSEIEAVVDTLEVHPSWHVTALMDLARACDRLGDAEAAARAWSRALRVAVRIGAEVWAHEIAEQLSAPPGLRPEQPPPDDPARSPVRDDLRPTGRVVPSGAPRQEDRMRSSGRRSGRAAR